MKVKPVIALAAMAGAVMMSVMGCNGTNHDAPNPTVDIQLKWWRMETPPSVVTTYFACFGTTGMYLDQADGNLSQIQNDPMCPKNGTSYSLVERHASDPAIPDGTYNLVPPDSTGKWDGINGRA